MFAKSIIVAALAVLAAAGPVARSDAGQCNTGSLQCCNTTKKSSDKDVTSILGLLGVVADADAIIGLNCNPITAIGVSGTSCSQQPVCCSGNNFNGLVVVGCTPINANV